MKKIEIGMMVRPRGNLARRRPHDRVSPKMLGQVVAFSFDGYPGVHFPGWKEGHSLSGRLATPSGFWFNEDELRLAIPEPENKP